MSSEFRFDVHPSVVFQLGADLISDDAQALIELVKNSYDAGASYAKIEIDTQASAKVASELTLFGDQVGFIKISDDGHGMTREAIRDGWLVVSNSAKRAQKRSKLIASGARTPLGDKGLGRLGAQRLAENVEVFTCAVGGDIEYQVGFSWHKFEGVARLSSVEVQAIEHPAKRKHGTTLLLSGLRNIERWKGPDAKRELEERLSELVSPFEAIEKFDLIVTVDGTKLAPAQFSKRLRNEADSTFSIAFGENELSATGKVKLRYLEPGGHDRASVFAARVLKDGGEKLREFLQAQTANKGFRASAGSGKWFLKFEQTWDASKLDKIKADSDKAKADSDKAKADSDKANFANPGPFRGELDGFDLDSLPEQSAFGSRKEFRAKIKALAAVRVYRDGFGVRVDRDFLKLSKAWTGGGSWYGLKPANTIGFIAITAAGNPDLVETTDREGFKHTPHYQNFELLLEEFVGFTHDVLEFCRRGTIDFCDKYIAEVAQVDPALPPEELARRVGSHFERATKLGEEIETIRKATATRVDELRRAVESVQQQPSLFGPTKEAAAAQKVLEQARSALEKMQLSMSNVAQWVQEAAKAREGHRVLQIQIEQFTERLTRAHEAMGLGLTAEALAHEIAAIADGLATRVADAQRQIKSAAVPESVKAFVRHVDAAVAALRKQLAHLDPSLRYVRERREVIDINAFLEEIAAYHRERWREAPLAVEITKLSRKDFSIEINRGKLTQIFDNLFLNGEYWLREELRLGRLEQGVIKIEVQPPLVWFGDNGRGIDPAVESSLFDPFVTTRRGGRGLGLFIVREFLESEGGSISLYPERNKSGRYYAFELNFSGLIHGADERE
ncbi:sensor histidine kinase [Archangium violaceum]|uniref:sensor histidine kinase n=1 Tax=Archangium violaceum TaxID=83451 RepID=UPI002B2BA4DB|nr:sensor histidine kinase [Archangium gephyra]